MLCVRQRESGRGDIHTGVWYGVSCSGVVGMECDRVPPLRAALRSLHMLCILLLHTFQSKHFISSVFILRVAVARGLENYIYLYLSVIALSQYSCTVMIIRHLMLVTLRNVNVHGILLFKYHALSLQYVMCHYGSFIGSKKYTQSLNTSDQEYNV